MKKILSLVLCVFMLVSIVPMMASAETEYEAQELYSNPFTDNTNLKEGTYGSFASISGNKLYLKNASGGASNVGWWEKADIDVSAAKSDRLSISFTVKGIGDRAGDLFTINGVLVLRTYSKKVDGVTNPAIRILKDGTNGTDYVVSDTTTYRIEFDIVKSTGEGKVTVYNGNTVVASQNIRTLGEIGDTLKVKFGSSNSCKLYIDNLYVGSYAPATMWVDGHQTTAVDAEGKYNVRFVGVLSDLPAGSEKVGFEISAPAFDKTWDLSTSTVYYSLKANFGAETITAEKCGGKYITAAAITGIPADVGAIEFVITPYVVFMIDGVETKVYGKTKTVSDVLPSVAE